MKALEEADGKMIALKLILSKAGKQVVAGVGGVWART